MQHIEMVIFVKLINLWEERLEYFWVLMCVQVAIVWKYVMRVHEKRVNPAHGNIAQAGQ
jgi:hypothetical protein